MSVKPIQWDSDRLELIDQRYLPNEETYQIIENLEQAHAAIKDMVVRGAPCIGFTAIFSMALWLKNNKSFTIEELNKAAQYLISSRPTAVNLEFETMRVVNLVKELISKGKISECYFETVKFGVEQMENAYEQNLTMAKIAKQDLEKIYPGKKLRLMTHCNTGTLACGTLGTALGVISHCFQENIVDKVWVDETRPYMQGSRLTAYELSKENIPYDIVVEGASSFLMSNKLVDAIFVGADRIAANGDTANKVGTSSLAIVANYYNIPFYVVAPTSSFDTSLAKGSDIEVEMRDPNEILKSKGQDIAPAGATAYNPSFDITPNKLIKGIICENGMIRPGKDDLVKIVEGR